MSFIDKLEQLKVHSQGVCELKDMLVGTYKRYLETNKQDTLDVAIKLSYMLGKEMGKEEMQRNTKKTKRCKCNE